MNRGRERKLKTSSPSLIPMGIEPPRDLLPFKHDFPKLLLVLAISTLVACFYNLFFTSFMIEEVCPTHGECYAGMLECFKGYRKHPNLCVEDSEISESARKIVERVEFYLCEEYAQFMCYETGSIWVSEDELWNCLEPFGDVSSDNTLYNFTKEKAIELIGIGCLLWFNHLIDMRQFNQRGQDLFIKLGPRDGIIQCFIKRDKSNSTYNLSLCLSPALLVENGKFLLSAKRTRITTYTEYVISMDADNISRSTTEEEAAEAYDRAGIKFQGANAVTNFEMSRYDVDAIMKSSLLVGGAAKRLKLSLESEQNLF
ncbi:hypothetical protein Ahy_A02g008639 isoform B [Arachis hypogaea]|uniref:Tubby C-terminal domain-containing protein n=1 Tax=Arachis hypogaea TaxID=3818 RepID=A0A445EEU6_ARAHY|nr:hypothetical protein Ahy_A07g035915 isoform A [Arachis hypogaea]RYR74042.1 hypothetical protein Ahy_A02g008639 isoform B [Arachis hypogaea]